MKYILQHEWLRNCLLLAFIMLAFSFSEAPKLSLREIQVGAVFLTGIYAACWMNNKIINHFLLSTNQVWVYAFLFAPLFGAMVFLDHWSFYALPEENTTPYGLSNSIISCVLYLLIGFGINSAYREIERRQAALEHELIAKRNELRFLQNQVNPHFLFNSLNNLYSASLTEPDKISERILQMAELLRYQLSSSKREFVPLDEERGFLLNYLDVEKRRLGRQLLLTVETAGDFGQMQVAPLLFFPFLENALKYSTGAIEPAKVDFRLESRPGAVRFFVENTIPENAPPHLISTGIGIENVQKRLELLYPDRFELRILPQKTSFMVDLTIQF